MNADTQKTRQAYRIKHVCEYVALRGLTALLSALPYRVALGLGYGMAWIAFFVLRFRVREALRRIREVFGPELPASAVRRIAWTSLRNLVFNVIDAMRIPRMRLETLPKRFEAKTLIQTLRKHLESGRGCILATPHMGSWEAAGIVLNLNGLPIFSIAADQKNPLVNRFLNRLRSATGMEVVSRGSGAMKEVLRRLDSRQMLAILPDVRVRSEGIRVPFLGGTANLGKGMGLFARHADLPIFPCIVRRNGWAQHTLSIHDPIFPDQKLDKDEDIRRMTSAVMALIEKAIREEPGQWFWFNKKWVLERIEEGDARREHTEAVR